MGLIGLALLGIMGVVGAVCSKLLADEFKAWAPLIVAKIIAIAVQRLPAEKRERFFEEWHSHVNEVPGDLGKVATACGFLSAAWDIAEGPFGLRKRALDLSLTAIVLIFNGPLLLLIGVMVATTSPGPILVRQNRVGYGGKRFRALRFRTMYEDADERLRAYLISNDEAKLDWAATGKLRFDPRITATGSILLNTSLDQLPQLLNVLAGDMSLVGPRLASGADPNSSDSINACTSCKPGVTGLWIFGRRFKDASYTSNWSLTLDLKIILATIVALLRSDENDGYDSFEADWKLGLTLMVMIALGCFGTVIIRLLG